MPLLVRVIGPRPHQRLATTTARVAADPDESAPSPSQLDTQRHTADDHAEETRGDQHETDGQEDLPVAAARLSEEEATDDGQEQPASGLEHPGQLRVVRRIFVHLASLLIWRSPAGTSSSARPSGQRHERALSYWGSNLARLIDTSNGLRKDDVLPHSQMSACHRHCQVRAVARDLPTPTERTLPV